MDLKSQPIDGKYGIFGGKYVPETLMNTVNSLEKRYEEIKDDKEFQNNLARLLKAYPLTADTIIEVRKPFP